MEVTAVHKDHEGAKLGMWLFLVTELLLFGGMFLLYAMYRAVYPEAFNLAASELNVKIGTLNTVILLTSSLTIALSVTSLKMGRVELAKTFLLLTILLGSLFLLNKYFEWSAKISHGIFPSSEKLLHREKGEALCYGLYFTMTGIHGLHVLIGVLIFLFLYLKSTKMLKDPAPLENSGLYWHFVDIIWIFLFPLFYLIT